MELTTTQYEVQRTGSEEFILLPGDALKIETNLAAGGGEEKLTYTVPAKGPARINIRITVDEETEEEEP